MTTNPESQRILSGMRATGRLHLGHYHGVLKNWIELQHQYECFFFIADWHALTTHYENPHQVESAVWEMLIDWLAAGIRPSDATLFIQSWVPEHAELHLLLSMMTPLGWLERVPSYKDQQEKLSEKDLSTYGFLGYPLLQSADILIYKAKQVPVGADQVAHLEMTREVARRFNFLYGRKPGFEEAIAIAIKKMSKKSAKLYKRLKKEYQEKGNEDALQVAQALIQDQQQMSHQERQKLLGDLEGSGQEILPEPIPMLTKSSKLLGLDGQKMSKSYGNVINLRESPESIERKIKRMPTDPARVRRNDPGTPEKCPVWSLHQTYSDAATKAWVCEGCESAAIGCLECKRPVIDAIQQELAPIRERAKQYEENHDMVKAIVIEGSEVARDTAKQTLQEVKEVIGLNYR